ncbi:hypothetical protein BSKO_01304 [Bryopsis sp. KO-2023]|nr:hypothetical protein BSKO_01304 [Bryopsis sp. KO-2023]
MSIRGAKESIDFVCSLLRDLGIAHLTSEHMRQAKFNGPTSWAVWRALHDLLLLVTVDFATDHVDLELFWKRVEEENAEKEIPTEGKELARKFLELHGYPRLQRWVQGRLHDVGSRDVLLALGWVIIRWDILEKALRRRFENEAFQTLLPPYPQELRAESNARERSKESRVVDISGWEGCEYHSQTCQRQLGRTRLKLDSVASLQTAKSKLSHRIAQLQWEFRLINTSCSSRILTPYEMSLAMDPKKLASHEAALRSSIRVLDGHKIFKQHSTIFAKWLSSVVHEETRTKPSAMQAIPTEDRCSRIETLGKVQGMDQRECVEAAKKLYARASPQLAPFLKTITSTPVRKNPSTASGRFRSILSSISEHTLVPNDRALGIPSQNREPQVDQPLPEDILMCLSQRGGEAQGTPIIKTLSTVTRRNRFVYTPLTGPPPRLASEAEVSKKADTITDELIRVLDSASAISKLLAKIGSANKDQLRRCLEPLAGTHVILGL